MQVRENKALGPYVDGLSQLAVVSYQVSCTDYSTLYCIHSKFNNPNLRFGLLVKKPIRGQIVQGQMAKEQMTEGQMVEGKFWREEWWRDLSWRDELCMERQKLQGQMVQGPKVTNTIT